MPGRAQEPGRLELHRAQPRMGADPDRRASPPGRPMPAAPPRPRPPRASPAPQGTNSKRSSTRPGLTTSEDRRLTMTDVMVPALGESVSEATVVDLVQEARRRGGAGRDAVRARNRQGLGRGALARRRASWPRSSPPKARPSPPTPARHRSTEGAGAAPAACRRRRSAEAPAPAPSAAPRPRAAAKDVEDAPSAKKAMAEAGLARDQVTGTGRDGRVMKEDVARAVAAPSRRARRPCRPPPCPRAPVPADDAAREERVKMTRLRADHRPPPEGRAEHRRHADHLQRGRHVRHHGPAQRIQGRCSRRSTA